MKWRTALFEGAVDSRREGICVDMSQCASGMPKNLPRPKSPCRCLVRILANSLAQKSANFASESTVSGHYAMMVPQICVEPRRESSLRPADHGSLHLPNADLDFP